MAYAVDIINESFKKTKELFFPIRTKYWLRMGFISLFGNRSGGGSAGNSFRSSSSDNNLFKGLSFKEAVQKINSESLNFLSQYGVLVAIGFFLLYFVALIFTYINSVFTFMFIDGLLKKDIRIRKSFKENNSKGISLFFLRFIVGLICLAVFIVITLPLSVAFFTNTLSSFNLWWLLFMIPAFILYLFVLGIFWFLVNGTNNAR